MTVFHLYSSGDPGTAAATGSPPPDNDRCARGKLQGTSAVSRLLHPIDEHKSHDRDTPLVGRTTEHIIKGLDTGTDEELGRILTSPTV